MSSHKPRTTAWVAHGIWERLTGATSKCCGAAVLRLHFFDSHGFCDHCGGRLDA